MHGIIVAPGAQQAIQNVLVDCVWPAGCSLGSVAITPSLHPNPPLGCLKESDRNCVCLTMGQFVQCTPGNLGEAFLAKKSP